MSYFLILILSSFLIISCQHKNPQTINYDQLQLYSRQKESTASWVSKSRSRVLGNMPLSSTAKPLFGIPFYEAKELVRILDTRSEAQFVQKNLNQNEETKTPVIHIPWNKLKNLAPESMKAHLQDAGITPSNIIIVLSNPLAEGKLALQLLISNGYDKSLYYDYAY